MSWRVRIGFFFVAGLLSALSVFAQVDNSVDPLVRLLETKGLLTPAEARTITENASPKEQRDRLAALLRDKGVISSAEFEAVQTAAASTGFKTITADYKPSAPPAPAAEPQQ